VSKNSTAGCKAALKTKQVNTNANKTN